MGGCVRQEIGKCTQLDFSLGTNTDKLAPNTSAVKALEIDNPFQVERIVL